MISINIWKFKYLFYNGAHLSNYALFNATLTTTWYISRFYLLLYVIILTILPQWLGVRKCDAFSCSPLPIIETFQCSRSRFWINPLIFDPNLFLNFIFLIIVVIIIEHKYAQYNYKKIYGNISYFAVFYNIGHVNSFI